MTTEEKNVVEYRARDGIQVKLTPQIIKRYLVSGKSELVTDQELFMYMGLCKSRGLNPFIKDCYITKFSPGDPAAIITSIDYYRKRARAQKDCKGWRVGIIVQGEKGALEYRNGCILLDGETLIGGWAEATPEGWTVPARKEVNLKRYIKKTREGVVTRFWSPENQPEQIAKVAESQLLRAVWPDEFQGLYVDSEMQSRDAQEDFNVAVSTATPADQSMADFDTVFANEIADPMFAAYLKAACELYKLTEDQAREEFAKQPNQIKRLFADWKKQPQRKQETDKATSTPSNGHSIKAPTETNPETKPPKATFRDEWINLKGPGFSTHVFKHLDRFKALGGEEYSEAVAKWQKLYPENKCPFVAEKAPETGQENRYQPQGEEKMPWEGEVVTDPEKSELGALKAEIAKYEKAHSGYVLQAKRETGIALPITIDACRVLLEKIEQLLRDRPPGNGK